MQIIIKQSEIEVAVKNYIAELGINLTGKDVEVSFTAGRKEDGLSASLDIVDATMGTTTSTAVLGSLNEFTSKIEAQVATQPASAKSPHVSRTPVAEIVPSQVQEVVETVTAVEAPAEVIEAAPVEAANEAEAQPAKKVSSLFG